MTEYYDIYSLRVDGDNYVYNGLRLDVPSSRIEEVLEDIRGDNMVMVVPHRFGRAFSVKLLEDGGFLNQIKDLPKQGEEQ